MRILVTGASGNLGRVMVSRLAARHTVISSHRIGENRAQRLLDLTDSRSCAEFFLTEQINAVIHLAALTNPGLCQAEPERALEVNFTGTRNLLAAMQAGTMFVFVSTDYVFDGEEPPYSESDPMNPINVYGDTKRQAETLVRKMAERFLIIRLPALYGLVGGESSGLLEDAMDKICRNEKVEIDDTQVRYPTSFADAARAIEFLLGVDHRGIFHVSASQAATKYGFTLALAHLLGKNGRHIARRRERPLEGVPRPRDCALSTSRFKSTGGPLPDRFPDVLAALKADLETIINGVV